MQKDTLWILGGGAIAVYLIMKNQALTTAKGVAVSSLLSQQGQNTYQNPYTSAQQSSFIGPFSNSGY